MSERRSAGRAALLLKIASLTPLLLWALAYATWPEFRRGMNSGVRLLATGDLPGLEAWGADLGLWAPFGTLLLMIVQAIAAPIPALFVTWTNSLLFGPFVGGLWSIATATLAASFCFVIARAFGEPLVARLIPEATLARTNDFVERHGGKAVLVARLIPIVPFDPISFVAGLSRIRFSAFFWATLAGQIPAGMTYSYLGQEITRPARLVLYGACGFFILLVMGFALRRLILPARETPAP